MGDSTSENRSVPFVRSLGRADRGRFALPSPHPGIAGRDKELEAIVGAFHRADRQHVVTLTGLGGIGKSTLAIEAARRLAPEFPDGVLFVSVGRASSQEVIGDIVGAFAPTARLPADPQSVKEIYDNLLAGKKVLLVLDDVWDRQQVDLLSPPAPAALLVTSRNRLGLPEDSELRLGRLSSRDAVDLLQARIGPHRRFRSHELEAIAAACGYHPLALELAGSRLGTNPPISASQFLATLNAEPQDHAGSSQLTVYRALELSLHQLETQDPLAVSQLLLLAVFPASFSQSAAASIWRLDETDAERSLDRLNAWGFLFKGTDGRFSQHELVHDFIASRHANDLETARLLHAKHYIDILRGIAEQYKHAHSSAETLKSFEAERPNFEAAQSWAARNAGTSPEAAHLAVGYGSSALDVISLLLPPSIWTSWLEAAVGANRTLNDQIGEAYTLASLSAARLKQGEAVQAMVPLDRCIELSQLIGDKSLEARALGLRGLANSLLGNLRQAIECYQRNLEIAREANDEMAEAAAIGNLGLAHASIGDTEHAMQLLERHLIMSKKHGDRLAEANAIGNLGLCIISLGDPGRAARLFEEQLAIAREMGDRRGEASALSNFGTAMFSQDALERATQAYEEALLISRQLGDRLQEAKILGNLGNIYLTVGQADAALDAYDQQIGIARSIGDARGEGNAQWNSALAFEAVGDRPAAIDRAKAALALRRKTSDPSAAKAENWLRERGTEIGAP